MDKKPSKSAIVLGAGVIGLSSAISLLKAGFDVEVWAKELSPNTTSDVAAAFWLPFSAEPRDKVLNWSKTTFDYAQKNLLNDSSSGCNAIKFLQLSESSDDYPWWSEIVQKLNKVTDDIPANYECGFEFETLLFDSSKYMNYLMESFSKYGGRVVSKSIDDISELPSDKLIINCLGLGSKEVFKDDEIYAVRGQVVLVEKNGFDKIVLDPDNKVLIVPRSNDIVLGATVQPNDYNESIETIDTERIIKAVKSLYPDYSWDIISEKVGLRPARSSVRLEFEKLGERKIIHNYGHGGSGYTISWGCALDVVELANDSF